MAAPEPRRRLIVNADDFGRTSAINAAVIQAHCEGILTTASLMVNEPAAAEAVALARQHPTLGVGLHLTLACGRAALAPDRLPGLVNPRGEFPEQPVRVGWRYFVRRDLRAALRAEMHAQFAAFRATGLPLDHVNGHLHLHLHPTVLGILLADADALGIRHLRLTRDPFWLNARLAGGRWGYRLTHAVLFGLLAAHARVRVRRRAIRHTRWVFGLLQHARVDESFLLRLLPRLPPGDSELYSHPGPDQFAAEWAALLSPRVRRCVEERGIQLIRYRDL